MIIIANPNAGRGRCLKVAEKVEAHLKAKNIPYEMVWTTKSGEATELARQAAERDGLVVALGGDGTAREVAAGLLGTDAKLGVLAGGTGNDYYHGLDMPKDPEAAVDVLLEGHVRMSDVGFANETPFINVSACGLDMDLYEASIPIKKVFTGIVAYILALFVAVPKFRPHVCRVAYDDQPAKYYEADLVVMCISPYFGGGMKAGPNADPTDGELDLAVIHNYYRRHILFMLPNFIKGRYDKIKKSVTVRSKKIVITSEVPLPFEVDGDIGPVCDAKNPVTVTIQHQALPVIAPKPVA